MASAGRRRYAGLVTRVTALGVDVVALVVAGLIITLVPRLAWVQMIGRSPAWLVAVTETTASVLPWAYFTACWAIGGRTIGGALFGTAVTRTDGRRVALVVAAGRALIGLALAPLWLVGLGWVLFDGRRRAWHDLVFRTTVRRILTPVVSVTVPAAPRYGSAGLDE
jgi:uncharacterized RDD family membrane protein YckC